MIIETGTLDEVSQAASDQAVKRDLNGNCLIPSFIDTHSHFVMNGRCQRGRTCRIVSRLRISLLH